MRPSSKVCNRVLKISGWAFSTSSNNNTEYGRRRTASVSCPPSSKPHSRGGEPINLIRNVFPNIRTCPNGSDVFANQIKIPPCFAQFGFAHTGRPPKNKKTPKGLSNRRQAGAGATNGVGDGVDGGGLSHHAGA